MFYDEKIQHIVQSRKITDKDINRYLPQITSKKSQISDVEARALIKIIKTVFDTVCDREGKSKKMVKALTTKFRDAGRRSAPWKPASSKVPGRPQDGSDGNRINRWLLPTDHKFYATEVMATLVEVKYYLQSLSMADAPSVKEYNFMDLFSPWLLEHTVFPGKYLDPVQKIVINFNEVLSDPRTIQSGHIHPLDRGGKHLPVNTFLMLSRSNQLQGNLTVDELLDLMRKILKRHS